MTITTATTRTIGATPDEVWQVLADFGTIAQWSRGVRTSELTGEAAQGTGATRHCELSPAGSLDETITAWEPERLLGISVDNIKVVPMKHVDTTFALRDNGDGSTDVTMTSVISPKGGPLAGLVGRRLQRGLPKAADALLSDLGRAAQQVRDGEQVG